MADITDAETEWFHRGYRLIAQDFIAFAFRNFLSSRPVSYIDYFHLRRRGGGGWNCPAYHSKDRKSTRLRYL